MTAGLILAADEAAAFTTPLPLAELDGRPLIAHAIEAMLGVDELLRVVVVLGFAAEEVEPALEPWDVDVVVCPRWRDGEGEALRCGLQALDEDERIVVALGDQPRISSDAIGAVLAASGGGAAAARAVYGGEPGFPVALGPEALVGRDRLAADDSIEVLLDEVEVRAVEAGHLGRPERVAVPDDLVELRADV